MTYSRKRGMVRWLLAAAALVLLLPAAVAQRGAIVQPVALDQIVAGAGVIVRGTVMAVRAEKHPRYSSLDTLVVTLDVLEVYKGGAPKTLSFRLYLPDVRDTYDRLGYREGQEVILFLAPTSRAGLTAPIGLEQGRFLVRRAGARASAANGYSNARLFHGLREDAARRGVLPERLQKIVMSHKRGAIDLADLEEMVRAFARRRS